VKAVFKIQRPKEVHPGPQKKKCQGIDQGRFNTGCDMSRDHQKKGDAQGRIKAYFILAGCIRKRGKEDKQAQKHRHAQSQQRKKQGISIPDS